VAWCLSNGTTRRRHAVTIWLIVIFSPGPVVRVALKFLPASYFGSGAFGKIFSLFTVLRISCARATAAF
jgi:hypothetical protein